MNKKGSFYYIAIIIFIILIGLFVYSVYIIISKQMHIKNYLEFAEEDRELLLGSLGNDYARVYVVAIASLFFLFMVIYLRKKQKQSMQNMHKQKHNFKYNKYYKV